ncbi:hypothetical protein [Streptosporangium amethystogenes]|uniref:hypothetical protein n=1 Tax=Streptosporangium amethystogenes TaxID=2002 RepID=UPI0004CA7847|nr:hypothetical protein [Streptosporangium amethystogenes]
MILNSAGPARVDVETVLLCDVHADGTVTGVALVEPIYDTNSGDRVGTRTVDPGTGAPYTPTGTLQPCQPDGCNATTTSQILCDTAGDGTITHFVGATTYDCEGALLGTLDRTLDGAAYTVTGTVGVCPLSPDCEAQTTPTAMVGLCLADGTPIAVTVVRDCTGVVTSEGWLNLSTGAWSAGAVPAGTVACGESRSIQVSGTFCDIDAGGEVIGLALVEYTYDDTGAIASVRDYARDENGAIVGHSDYGLDGTPYTPTGTVGSCSVEPCRNSTTVMVCDAPADSSTSITPTIVDGVAADVGQTQFQNHPGPYTALWSGGTFIYPAGAGPAQEHLIAVGQLTADMAGCDGAAGTLTISVHVRNDGPDSGQEWDGALGLFRGTTALATQNALLNAPVGWEGRLTVSAPVTAADLAAGDIRVALMLETYHLGAKQWTADQFTVSLGLEGCEVTSSTQFLRTLVTDCATGEVVSTTDTTLDGQPYIVTGTVGQCTPSDSGSGSSSDCRDCEQFMLCDTADGVFTAFLRTVCRDCTGAVISVLDTDLDGTAPYAVTGEVGQCATPPAECEAAAVQAFRLCDLNPDVEPDASGLRCFTPFLRHFVYGCDGTSTFHDTEIDGVTPYTPMSVVECGANPPSLREQVWNTLSIAPDPADTTNRVFIYTVVNSEDPSQTGTVRLTASAATPNGCGGTPTNPVWNAAVTFTFEPDANVLALADVLRIDHLDWDTWEDKVIPAGSPLPDRVESTLGHTQVNAGRWHSVVSNNTGHFYYDGPPSVVRVTNRNDGGGTACVAPAIGFITLVPGPPCGVVPEVDHIVQPLCDVAAAGTVTPFLRHWAVDNATGLLTALQDTTLNGTSAYTPTGTVAVCGQQTDAPVLTGVRRVTGVTTL